ncbi:MAG: lysophospholipid acyltransferase family protein [Eubacteriales bacterium]|nr:lysophospholipid acyltransferase family protein [Eubacteriales bacterium]
MTQNKRHVFVWKLLRVVLGPWLRRKFAFTVQEVDVPGPYLVLSNHNTDWDPFLLSLCFPQHMYFVASEHIFRWRFLSPIIRWLTDPIARQKGRTAADTAMTTLRRLRRGSNVCIFAEGNRSWDGVTGDIFPATGKLARSCGKTVITFRLEGGYLSSPRWAHSSLRRGRMRGKLIGVYPPEQLRAMTPDEVSELIARDLHEDIWVSQRTEPVAYRGSRPAEHLETLLCLCPSCGQIGTLHSDDASFRCSCGLETHFSEYGFFEGGELPFETVRDWVLWQDAQLCAKLDNAEEDTPLLKDTAIRLTEILPGHKSLSFGSGTLLLFPDRLEWNDRVFPFSQISGVSLHANKNLDLGFGTQSFEFKSTDVCCLRKYMTLITYAAQAARAAK